MTVPDPLPFPGSREPVRSRRYAEPDEHPEIHALPAGDVTEGIIRIGDTVRRPAQPQSFAVAAFLDHLADRGFDGAPRFLGRDASGRDVLTFLHGDVAGDPVESWALDEQLLVSVGELVRRAHEAAIGYRDDAEPFPDVQLVPDAELVAHMDVTPQNVVVRQGRAVALIDFDLARPTTRLLDGYNTALHWSPLRDPVDMGSEWLGVEPLHRLRILADALGWSREQRLAVPRLGAEHALGSWERMRWRADNLGGGWSRMWNAGVGDVIRRRGEWLTAEESTIVAALLIR